MGNRDSMCNFENDPHGKTKTHILWLNVTLIIIYFALMMMDIGSMLMFVFYVWIPLLYNIIDMSVFFGCKQFNWPTTISFRIIFILADVSFALTYASIATGWYRESSRREIDGLIASIRKV